MKTAEDFRRAIGPADGDFEAAIGRALRKMKKTKKRPGKRRLLIGLAVLLILSAAGTAYAAGADFRLSELFDLWKNHLTRQEESVTAFSVTGNAEAACAVYQVREAYWDGEQVRVVIAVSPRDENALVMPEAWLHMFRTGEGGTREEEDFLSLPLEMASAYHLEIQGRPGQTIGEYLEEKGKYIIPCNLSLFLEDEQGNLGFLQHEKWNFRTLPDGTLLTDKTLPWQAEGEEARIKVCGELNKRCDGIAQWPEEENWLRITIPARPLPVTAARGEETALFERSGVRGEVLSARLTDFGLDVLVRWEWDQAYSESVIQDRLVMGIQSPADPNAWPQYTAPSEANEENRRIQEAYFSEVTQLPESLTLICAGEKRSVRLVSAPWQPLPEEEITWIAPPQMSVSRLEVPIAFTRNGMRAEKVTARQQDDGLYITVSWDWDDSEHKYVQLNPAPLGARLPGQDAWQDVTRLYGKAQDSEIDLVYMFPVQQTMPDSVFIRYGEEEVEIRLYPEEW